MGNSSRVSQPHDKLIKKLLSNKATARDIFGLYLPSDVLQVVDLDFLELQRDSFIDDEHRAFAVDILYKTKFQNEAGYIWILLEHQSKSDVWMPVRVFKYIAIIWDHIRKQSNSSHIPLVYPLIIYNGKCPYAHSLSLRDLIFPPQSQKLFDGLFERPFQLIDLTQIEDETLRAHVQNQARGVALLLTVKYTLDKNLDYIFKNSLLRVYKFLDQRGDTDDVIDMLYYMLNEGKYLNKDYFWSVLQGEFSEEVEVKMMSIAQQLRAEGKKEGKLEEKCSLAKKLLAERFEVEVVAKFTGLSIQTICGLQVKDKVVC